MGRRQSCGGNPNRFVVGASLLLIQSIATASWVDPDTLFAKKTTKALTKGDDRRYELVFSDEFEVDGRTFHDGNDPRWTALNKNDYTNDALQYYSHDNAVTANGTLRIYTEQKENLYKAFDEDKKEFYADKKYIQSAMLQSWNKFCFTGGIVEFSAKLPGDGGTGGLWPALWMLGNLARATYVGSSDYVWPYSFNQCDPKKRAGQAINACSKVNHYGLLPEHGRGAPEIDVIESMQGDSDTLPSTNITRPYQSVSFQVAPGLERNRPLLGRKPRKGHWYEGMEYSSTNSSPSELNPFFYGVKLEHEPKQFTYQADALSANMQLRSTHYERHHIYRVEWEPPEEDGTGGYIRWYTDDVFIYSIKGSSLSLTNTEIPSEPLYLLMNTAVSKNWGFPAPCPEGCECTCFECGNPDCACALPTGYCDNFPATFEIDYVRVYQAVGEEKHIQGCSPEKRPTDLFIRGHAERYMEKGQKQPLLPLRRGGAFCSSNNDCGDGTMGYCAEGGMCVCHSGSAGPNCLAHDGYYVDESSSEEIINVEFSRMFVPWSMIAVVLTLFVGFISAVIHVIRSRTGSRKYTKLSYTTPDFMNHSGTGSYQNPSYSNAPQSDPKVVTYCVIDDRLVDE